MVDKPGDEIPQDFGQRVRFIALQRNPEMRLVLSHEAEQIRAFYDDIYRTLVPEPHVAVEEFGDNDVYFFPGEDMVLWLSRDEEGDAEAIISAENWLMSTAMDPLDHAVDVLRKNPKDWDLIVDQEHLKDYRERLKTLQETRLMTVRESIAKTVTTRREVDGLLRTESSQSLTLESGVTLEMNALEFDRRLVRVRVPSERDERIYYLDVTRVLMARIPRLREASEPTQQFINFGEYPPAGTNELVELWEWLEQAKKAQL